MPEYTITQSAYIVGVTKQKIVQDLFRTFWALISKNLNPNAPTKFWYPSFPFLDLDAGRLSYPIGIIESPNLSWEKFTFEKKWVMGTIVVEVYATQSSQVDDLMQQAINAVESERKTLWDLNVRKVNLTQTTNDHFMRDEVKVQVRTMRWEFQTPMLQSFFE